MTMLTGKRVVVPRDGSNTPMANSIRRVGGEPVGVPLTSVVPAPDRILLNAIRFDNVAWLVMTSPRAVGVLRDFSRGRAATFGQRINQAVKLGMKVAAVGPATTEALHAAGAPVHLVAPSPGSAATLASVFPAPDSHLPVDQRWVLLPSSALASPALAAHLADLGWTVDRQETYTTVTSELSPRDYDALTDPWPDAILVTSGSTAQALIDLGPPPASTALVAIGEPTAAAMRDLELPVAAIATEPTPSALTRATERALA